MIIIKILLYPVLLVIMFPVEYPLWKVYKSSGYQVWSYWKYLWVRMYGTIEQNHYQKRA